jgi:NAD(P)-dependent dehydrogenase (short-subunit alcohol dehydrogenase family)
MVHLGAKGSDEGTGDYFRKMIPIGRLGTADELASAAVFIASDESSFVTASTCQSMVAQFPDNPPSAQFRLIEPSENTTL